MVRLETKSAAVTSGGGSPMSQADLEGNSTANLVYLTHLPLHISIYFLHYTCIIIFFYKAA